jgi:aminoglycoside 6'-N-acetyltransferase
MEARLDSLPAACSTTEDEMDKPVSAVDNVSLEPCDPAKDKELLYKWFSAPHVAEWWGDARRNIEEMIRPPAGGGNAYIAVGSVPVGYVRWQVPSRNELQDAGLDDLPANIIDIDIAIGEPPYLSRGVGSRALRLLVQRLFTTEKPLKIIICTSLNNTRAIHAFEKAGFKRDRVFQDPECGPMWLLAVNRGTRNEASCSS